MALHFCRSAQPALIQTQGRSTGTRRTRSGSGVAAPAARSSSIFACPSRDNSWRHDSRWEGDYQGAVDVPLIRIKDVGFPSWHPRP